MTGGEPSHDAYRGRGDDRGGTCKRCGSEIAPPKPTSGSTGYGLIDLGDGPAKVCYPCCAEIDKEYMRKHKRIVLYIRTQGFANYLTSARVVNWPGSLTLPCIKWKNGKHNIGGQRLDVWFVFNDYIWWGVHYGFNNELVYCKQTQRKVNLALEFIASRK